MVETDMGGASPPALWDKVVRISHWGIAIVVFSNELFTKGGSVVHVWIGWAGLVLLAMRLVWGLVGSAEARFTAFPPSPRAAVAHVRKLLAGRPPHYRSHNPAGAMMVYALWGAIAVMIATGFAMSGPNPFEVARQQAVIESGDWSTLVKKADDAKEAEDESERSLLSAKTIHEVMANLILLLVSLHVAGIMVESIMMRRNLVPPMVLGNRKRR